MTLFSELAGRKETRGFHAAGPLEPASTLSEQGLDRAGLEQRVLDLVSDDDDARPVFVAAFGLDRFDRVRAVAGQSVVSEILARLARRLRAVEAGAGIARLSDDVLAMAFRADNQNEAQQRAEAARRAVQGPHEVAGRRIDVRLTAGLCGAGPPAALLREAELALDAARAERVTLKVFDLAAHAAAVGALSLMPDLRAAIGHDQLHLAHQLKRSLRTGQVLGVETLVRWIHPVHGSIPPDAFISIAEDTGDIHALTHWVLEQALAEQSALAKSGHALTFAVNLSARLITDDRCIDWILSHADARGGAIRLEITETAVIEHPDRAVANVARLASAGISCSIDDYGAGLSSLAYLKRLEVDELKLDRSLVVEAARSSRDAMVTKSVVDLAHGLGMAVVAEGVEDPQTAALVAAMGCDIGQGYFFGRPATLPELLMGLEMEREAPPLPLRAVG